MADETKSSNFYQALWLGIGELSVFLLSFISAAILSRYFDKTEYGTYKQILYVYTTLQGLFVVGLPKVFSYYLPRMKDGEQKTLINGMNRIFVIIGLFFSIVLFTLSDPIAVLLNNPKLATGLKIFSPFPLFTLPAMGVEAIYTALRKTRSLAIYNVVSKVLMLVFILGPVLLFHTDYRGAIIGWGLASFIIFGIAMIMKRKPYVKIEPEFVPNLYKNVFNFVAPLFGAFICGFFITTADQYFISHYFGTETFAEYSNGSLAIPIATMIVGSINAVLLPLFSKADAQKNMNNAMLSYNNAVNKSMVLVVPLLLFCVFFATDLMVFVYGEKYAASGIYEKCFLPREFIRIFPYFAVLIALGKSKAYMWMHVVGVIYIWIADFLAINLNAPAYVIMIVSSSYYVLSSLFAISYIFVVSRINLISKTIVVNMLKIFFHCCACLLIVMLLRNSIMSSWNVFIILLASGIVYYILITITGKLIKVNYLEVIPMLLKRK